MAETTAICTVYEKKHFLAKSMSAHTLFYCFNSAQDGMWGFS